MPHLVVARYNENLNWLRRVPRAFGICVYNKGGEVEVPPRDNLTIETLPNIGRESHTYLHHIVENYDHLAAVTVFCQGKPFDHAYDFHHILRDLAQNGFDKDWQPLGHIYDTDTNDGQLFKIWTKNENGRGLDFRAFHRALWNINGPDEYGFRLGAQFVVSREVIRNWPKSFYEKALQLSVSFPDAPHCFERCWHLVFGVEHPDLSWLNGRKTAYLKPVKRLMKQDGAM
jgi:hypothetical protein